MTPWDSTRAIYDQHDPAKFNPETTPTDATPMPPRSLLHEPGMEMSGGHHREGLRAYYVAVTTLDQQIGRLLDHLRAKGRESGAGFYHYSSSGEVVNEEAAAIAGAAPSGDPLGAAQIRERLPGLMVREARGCIEEGVVKSAEDIVFAMRLGTGFPARVIIPQPLGHGGAERRHLALDILLCAC